jgi:vitellogenic carboxypeptidase-like protein
VGIKNSYSALGFIFYGSAKASGINDLHNYPTIIWLNGGPGSSSQLGNFFELGPLWMSGDNYGNINFIPNNYSW